MMLNQESGNQNVETDITNHMSSSHLYESTIPNSWKTGSYQALSPLSWKYSESPLRICPPNTVYNIATLCCTDSSFYARIQKSMIVNDEDGKQYVKLQLYVVENFTDPGSINAEFYSY